MLNETQFAYDANGRLVSQTSPGSEVTFEYDGAGNRTKATETAGGETITTAYTYDDADRLIKSKSSNGAVTLYTYDDAGNLISQTEQTPETAEALETTYEYDLENRLNAVRSGDVLLMAALYDGLGNRVFQTHRHEVIHETQPVEGERLVPGRPRRASYWHSPSKNRCRFH